jgi:hypothetical protein
MISYPAYDVLDVSGFHHPHRIDHSDVYVLDRHNHINGIENFWNQAKRTLSRYNGIPKAHFPLFLKETEFRFNYGTPKIANPQTLGQTQDLAKPIWDSPYKFTGTQPEVLLRVRLTGEVLFTKYHRPIEKRVH